MGILVRLAATAAAAAALAACTSRPAPPATSPGPAAGRAAAEPGGPFKVTLTRCAGTSATVLVTNTSRAAYSASVQAAITSGGTVEATNTQATDGPVPPGQSEHVTILNVDGSGKAGSRSDRCELLQYGALDGTGDAGQWPLGR